MRRDDRSIDSELDALLERGRIIRPVPDVVRARALARARATVTAAPAFAPGPVMPARGRGLRLALAASVALALGAAGATAALRRWVPERATPPAPIVAPRVVPPARVLSRGTGGAMTPRQQATPSAKAVRLARAAAAQESYAAELELLQRAQSAYASRDFLGALVLVAEHGRRFPNGRLAEEGEALRVRSLVASGRDDEARRAGAAFARRFPRSVLLPRLQGTGNGVDGVE